MTLEDGKKLDGASAMHAVVTSKYKVLIIDKAERNREAILPDGKTGWSTQYSLTNNTFRTLKLTSDTFCSAGAFLANGTLVETAGGDGMGLTGEGYRKIRLFTPCEDASCTWNEIPDTMLNARWYNTMTTLPDGNVFIIGGSTRSVAINSKIVNNPTFEIYPRSREQIPLQFLIDTLPNNLYPQVHVLPDREDTMFLFANKKSILYNYETRETIAFLPDIPGPPRSYPLTGTSVLLPLSYRNNYKPEILICGGSPKTDSKAPAANSCGRIDLSKDKPVWDMDDFGGIGRVMPDSVILPNAQIVFINGAKKGFAGYVKAKGTRFVNSDPVFTPVLYDPAKEKSDRWTTLAPSKIARMYHSTATLIYDGSIFVAGSNPQPDFNPNSLFPTEYRAEKFYPPYFTSSTPRLTITSLLGEDTLSYSGVPIKIKYDQTLTVTTKTSDPEPEIFASIIHFGFVTHSTNMGQRFVELNVVGIKPTRNENEITIKVESPPNAYVIAPGPSYLFLMNKGRVCDEAVHVSLG
ncbi:6491_t:CDS:2 [Paraglomus brasilianum]|uniref:6491_t:CDS:1 n=1 Tax=Paraglomus brasilianum TaxID=144538 RepID=A0A9N8WF17_9GLOM|nr:6491_t:CDS:2 [Paraglomus brasilianum]